MRFDERRHVSNRRGHGWKRRRHGERADERLECLHEVRAEQPSSLLLGHLQRCIELLQHPLQSLPRAGVEDRRVRRGEEQIFSADDQASLAAIHEARRRRQDLARGCATERLDQPLQRERAAVQSLQ
jgi:hypothetical protein